MLGLQPSHCLLPPRHQEPPRSKNATLLLWVLTESHITDPYLPGCTRIRRWRTPHTSFQPHPESMDVEERTQAALRKQPHLLNGALRSGYTTLLVKPAAMYADIGGGRFMRSETAFSYRSQQAPEKNANYRMKDPLKEYTEKALRLHDGGSTPLPNSLPVNAHPGVPLCLTPATTVALAERAGMAVIASPIWAPHISAAKAPPAPAPAPTPTT